MLTYPHIDPIAFSLGPLSVRWYGLMYLAGFVAFVALGRWRIARRPDLNWTAKDIDDLLFYGVLGVVIGGRLGQVLFYEPAHFLANPLEIFAVWQGGMSFHGGFLGVLVALWFFARQRHKRWLEVTDFVAPLIPLGLDTLDRKLLTTIIEKFDGGPVGIESLAAAIGEERGTLEDVIEPFLIQQGFLMRTARGRMATRGAYLHFGLRVPERLGASMPLFEEGR